MKNKTVTIYGLCSSEDGKIRYVGQTTQTIRARFCGHRWQAKRRQNYHISRWMAAVVRAGFSVRVFTIETDAVWNETEQRLVAWYRRHGARLVNSTDGGRGVLGLKNPKVAELNRRPERRAAVAAANRARAGIPRGPLSETAKAKIMATKKLRPWSASIETKAKMSAAAKARPPASAEARAKLSAALSGRVCPWLIESNRARAGQKRGPLSAEHRAKLSAVKKGHTVSAEARAKISAARTGRPLSEEHRRKIGEGGKGKKRSAEFKLNLAEKKRAWWKARMAATAAQLMEQPNVG